MPVRRRSFVAVVKATERALRAAKAEHVFVGALAVAAFGVPRTTTDVDVIVAYRKEAASELVDAFRGQAFRASTEDLQDALAQASHCTVHDTLSLFHVDLSPAVRPTAKDAIRNAVRVRWRGSILPIAGPEHTIVMKLKFGSDRDIEDALGIYIRQSRRLDVRGMREFARRQGVSENLHALEEKVNSSGKR